MSKKTETLTETIGLRAWDLFKLGLDTMDIADSLGFPEAFICMCMEDARPLRGTDGKTVGRKAGANPRARKKDGGAVSSATGKPEGEAPLL